MAETGRKDKVGGSDRDTKKVFPELRWGQVSVADAYLWIPVHCGMYADGQEVDEISAHSLW